MKPAGGTEILVNNLNKFTNIADYNNLNVIPSFCSSDFLIADKKNIVWQHNMPDQPIVSGMYNPQFVESVDDFVYVSEYQLNEYKKLFNLSGVNNHIIKNAIEPFSEYKHRSKQDKIRLIYTSAPFRGLDVLIDAFKLLNRNDVELHVYSSNIIYGSEHSKMIGDRYEHLFHACRKTDGIVYKGYAPNAKIREALQEAHILAYPCTFKETSCLAAIEAGAAGCKIVTTNYGALPETCEQYATYIDYTSDHKKLAENYAEILNKEVYNYWNLDYNYKDQSDWFNEQYSWYNRAKQWNEFFEQVSNK